MERGERGRGRKGKGDGKREEGERGGRGESKKNVMGNRYQNVKNKQKTVYTGDKAWGIFLTFCIFLHICIWQFLNPPVLTLLVEKIQRLLPIF